MKALLRKFGLAGFDPAADALYRAAVLEGRRELYYLEWPETARVPDTVDGRFDMISLMVTLIIRRIAACDPQGGPAQAKRANAVSQDLFDLFFADMDINLRELGVSDEGMKYKIKPMASAHMGRSKAYSACLDDAKDAQCTLACLTDALARNVYRAVDNADGAPLAKRTIALAEHLAAISDADVLAGRITFPDPAQKPT